MHTQEKKRRKEKEEKKKGKLKLQHYQKKKQGGVFVVKLYSVEPVFSSQPVLKGYPAIFCGWRLTTGLFNCDNH